MPLVTVSEAVRFALPAGARVLAGTAGLGNTVQWARVLRSHECREAIMVGRVLKTKMYGRWRYLRYIPDLTTARLWLTRLRRVSPLWWGAGDYHLYRLEIRLPGAPAAPIGLRIRPPGDLIER